MEGPVAGSDKHTGHRKHPPGRLFVFNISVFVTTDQAAYDALTVFDP